jgi:hypothetical protein
MGGSSIKHKMERKKVLAFLRPLDRATNTSKVQTTSRRYKTQNAWYKFRNFSWEKHGWRDATRVCWFHLAARCQHSVPLAYGENSTHTQRKHTHKGCLCFPNNHPFEFNSTSKRIRPTLQRPKSPPKPPFYLEKS